MQPVARAASSSDVLLNNLVLFGIVASPFVLVTALAIWATIAYPY
jgi:hypothetical protein